MVCRNKNYRNEIKIFSFLITFSEFFNQKKDIYFMPPFHHYLLVVEDVLFQVIHN